MALALNEIQKAMQGRDFLCMSDYTREELKEMIALALHLKKEQKMGVSHPILQGKTLAMIFRKSSTRTRVSFEVGMYQLGGYPLFLSSNDIQLGRGEPIADTARVLSRMVDGIMIRTFAQAEVEELAQFADVPVINGLTDLLHPCQVLADLMTIQEYKGKLAGLKLAYVGDGNNMAHSLLIGGAKMGMKVAVASPEGYLPQAEIVAKAQAFAAESGGEILVTTDPVEAVTDADVVYTDVWASMGQEAEAEERARIFQPYQVNEELVAKARADYLFLHCLPAHRGEEVTAGVIDGPNSVVFDEAENRLHAQKALLALLL
ncbi:ornithine carbamoyltransferase [Carboxydocella sporoproducens DSM 16521]|uniref:Ornithine carbamoyltransferase n=2 Tax=Carboxydocella TaxID=178898 RepID=A0A1T4R2C3_9FIRM|nr:MULTISPECIES: ornithine carbamoyltransferase [Carboxydocella]AVX21749.1 ornithine carbamoyltransferase [Carboxydocella thermautotrophica]AVX32155.1 ornithine carbamoyltransferase [Carboxydocella thermautotrophica]SKA10190.1 ornithine carbamoyltransferase [Carboxydocella sporoproducens DSM 16521]